jgi:hypothetical protein
VAKRKIYIRAGHGGTDPGAIAVDRIPECDINLRVALKVELKLATAFDTRMFRKDGTAPASQLSAGTTEADEWGADMFISIHHNATEAHTATGFQVLYGPENTEGLKLANMVAEEFTKSGQVANDAGVIPRTNLHELNKTSMPAVITEYCFIDSSADYDHANSDNANEAEANAIANAVATYFGITLSDASSASTGISSVTTGEIVIDVVANSRTNSNYENTDSRNALSNVETGVSPDIYDLVNSPEDDCEALRAIDPNIPKPFLSIWDKGFIMDWAKSVLETHKPDVKTYSYERYEGYNSQHYSEDGSLKTLRKKYSVVAFGITKEMVQDVLSDRGITDVKILDPSEQNYIGSPRDLPVGPRYEKDQTQYETTRMNWDTAAATREAFIKWVESVPHVKFSNKYDDGYVDTMEDASSYEFLEYSTEDFLISGVGGGTIASIAAASGPAKSGGAMRQKIIAKAQEIVDKCKAGKAQYDLGGKGRTGYGTVYTDDSGVEWYDCSIFAEITYLAAEINMPAPSGNQYNVCKQNGGFVSTDMTKLKLEGMPGDLLFRGENGGGHVGVYDGNGGNFAAHTHYGDARDITHSDSIGGFTAWGRCKALVDADSVGGTGTLSLTQDMIDAMPDIVRAAQGNAKEAISRMNQYGYKSVLMDIAKQYGYDPYAVLAIIAVESTGLPTANQNASTQFKGLMQVGSGERADAGCTNPYDPAQNIKAGCFTLNAKKTAIKQLLGIDSQLLSILAYNAGEGQASKYVKAWGKDGNYCEAHPGEFATFILAGGNGSAPSAAKAKEQGEYFIRVCASYQTLAEDKCLS